LNGRGWPEMKSDGMSGRREGGLRGMEEGGE
jgi:hypothetical protein